MGYTRSHPLILHYSPKQSRMFFADTIFLWEGKLRGQCYDGASAMQGARSGVAARVCKEEPRALYTHCYGHSINLAASDAIKRTKVMKHEMETAHEITKLVKYSPTLGADISQPEGSRQ